MKRILMILTSHRLDCLRICLDMALADNGAEYFDTVVFLENGVVGRHKRFISRFIAEHPEITWDRVSGPRGRGERISNLENECVKRHPNALYFKIDEDTFVSPGWAEKLETAYEAHKDDPRLSLITPVIPNNSAGAFFLLHARPDLGEIYDSTFGQPRTPYVNGPVATYPQIGEWLTREFLDVRKANAMLAQQSESFADNWKKRRIVTTPIDPDTNLPLQYEGTPPYLRFSFRFSINCLCYDYRHWQEIGGVPVPDEIGWGDWIIANKKYVVMVTDLMVHHYSYFVQQNWLDRTPLLEDMSHVNAHRPRHRIPQLIRIIKQIPGALHRRITGFRG